MRDYKKYKNIFLEINNQHLLYNEYKKINYKYKKKDIFLTLGEKYFTSTVLYYVLWIIENVKKDKIDIVCFLARDGYILKECYDLYKKMIDNNLPPSKYIFASRSIFYNAAITQNFDWTDKLICSLPFGQNIESYFIRWDINEEEYIPILNEMNISKDYIISNKADKDIIEKLYKKTKSVIIKKAIIKRKYLYEYWESLNLISKNVAFIDIGWNGSCQKCIEKIIEIEKIKINPYFYFLGTLKSNEKNRINPIKYKGCFLELGKPEKICEYIYMGIPLLDSFFSAPHPYILNIKKEKNQIVPVYDSVKELKNNEYAMRMQKGVINRTIKIFNDSNNFEIIKKWNIIPFIKLIKYPSKIEAKAFSKFKSSVTFGSEKYNKTIIKKIRIIELIKNRRKIKEEYDKTMWKIGYKKINNFIINKFLK